MLWRSLGEPLIPGSVIHGGPGGPAQMGSQHQVTGGHTGATGAADRLIQVHLRLLKELLQLLCGEHHALLVHKFEERHALGAGDVARFNTCGTMTNQMTSLHMCSTVK